MCSRLPLLSPPPMSPSERAQAEVFKAVQEALYRQPWPWMVKHKRKGPKGTEKESKKPKITSAEETQQASDAGPGKEAASSKTVMDQPDQVEGLGERDLLTALPGSFSP
ncbi:hypothetical protein U0070_017493 [Myodes glareolus]|uniref:Uncharacterized protein n=1 Tax=Myodes glareolus TaxID=447135 RepID=A0AAW0HWH3_MYOGA